MTRKSEFLVVIDSRPFAHLLLGSSSQTPFQTGSTDTYYYFLSEFVAAARRNFACDIARAIPHRWRWEVGAGLTLSSCTFIFNKVYFRSITS
jgi:hypothetical protein